MLFEDKKNFHMIRSAALLPVKPEYDLYRNEKAFGCTVYRSWFLPRLTRLSIPRYRI